MDIKIAEKKEAPLLYRAEVTVDITTDKATPSKEELKKKCASLLHTDEKLIVVKEINTLIGSKNSKALIYQYKDENKLNSIEPKNKEKKAKAAKEAKPEENK